MNFTRNKVDLGTMDSLPSRCSFLNQKHSSLLGRCILFILMLAVFVIGVLLAFFVGHWAAKSRKNADHLVGFTLVAIGKYNSYVCGRAAPGQIFLNPISREFGDFFGFFYYFQNHVDDFHGAGF